MGSNSPFSRAGGAPLAGEKFLLAYLLRFWQRVGRSSRLASLFVPSASFFEAQNPLGFSGCHTKV
jgi:hypothetical protein